MGGEGQPAALIVISALGRIVEVDEAACALVGYTREELVGMHGTELIFEDRRPRVAVSLDRMRRGDLDRRTGELRHKSGRVVPVEVEAEPRSDGNLALHLRAPAG